MNILARTFLLAAVAFTAGCRPKVSEKDLGFLATQKMPLTYQAVAKQLGETELGPGPCYSYPIIGTKKTVEFWFGPPPLTSQTNAAVIPVEIAVVAVRADGAKPGIIWPEDLKGKDFDNVIASVWPQH